jgi:hypothetical protein
VLPDHRRLPTVAGVRWEAALDLSAALGLFKSPVCALPHCRPGAKPGDAPVVTPEARSIEYPSLATVVTAPANKVWPLRKDLGAPFLAWRGACILQIRVLSFMWRGVMGSLRKTPTLSGGLPSKDQPDET